jgi:glycosyltransferase involved in cell wall biosynthesis
VDTGIVVIGRNEGERLRRCLESVQGHGAALVYVDSGSIDGSPQLAAAMGAHVVELDRERPFTAARARNSGAAKLREIAPDVTFVQFIDGDCELAPGWLGKAAAALAADPTLAIAFGRLRERHPEASPYNRLCDMEWEWIAQPGFSDVSGGIAMMRIAHFIDVGGFNPELIAGEEPDLCLRLRQRGHRILRLDAEMSTHDANLLHFRQWWRRMVRSGHAYAEGFARHHREPGRHHAREMASNLAWGALLPLLILALLWPTRGLGALLLLAYPLLSLRVYRSSRRRGRNARDARLYAIFCVLSKLPSAYGQLRYWVMAALGKRSGLIEHKPPQPQA